jgi:hypothetical protein
LNAQFAIYEIAGDSERIQHYVDYQNGKRVYQFHELEVNGSKLMEAKKG